MAKVVTRFAPSPTGYLHIGGARTALFNWLFARHNNGTFILRIENTDTQRSTQEYTQSILEALTWLGLNWDEGPYFQTDRLDIYRDFARKLYESGWAYYCECDPEDVERRRREAQKAGLKPRYDRRCRDKGLDPGPGRALRFRCPESGSTVLHDIVKGPIVFDNSELDDLVLIRRDGMPTYNFTVVVDDITMGITHVIRGDDHVNNTPKQILLYHALGAPLPVFAHVPMILGPDRTRLSKRHGATSVLAYRDMGYLPEAIVNYLARLGWSHGDQEIFSREELIEKFSLENIGTSASVFDIEKLRWLNGHYIRSKKPEELCALLKPFLQKCGYPPKPDEYILKAAITLQPRCSTLEELAQLMNFYMTDRFEYEESGVKKFFVPEILPILEDIVEYLEQIEKLDEKELEVYFRNLAEKKGIKLKMIAQPVRLALTGRTASPGLFEIMSILGKEEVINRLKRACEYIRTGLMPVARSQ
ncbi:glutamate--tRNA ligase [Thermodesulforhabdus norvegica]|uniref:Glutamate--tRNA ligase n=1 Tax=Thermodesulforhabdus norvegica TaxID=39841 RepID=A0A1I4SPK3_9BACT|nr:glutamate--tRNA ligase [Thermodesulforhabdus norvegica]SFM66339.1 glutamyl-tRNA synthetase [Thermodesulforhabdus norvegica]